jgi:beta-lactamase class A
MSLVDEVLNGYEVEILSSHDEFCRVRTFYNYEGYIHNKHIIKPPHYWENGVKLIIKKPFADISYKSAIKSNILTCIQGGSIVIKLFEGNDYMYIKTSSEEEGFIRLNSVSPYNLIDNNILTTKDKVIIRNKIIKSALSYRGIQYRWGGKSFEGIDCSGLCFMSYLFNGIMIERDTENHNKSIGRETTFNNLKIADLIYFKGHVGLYMGKGNFIHSSFNNNGVYINSLNKNSPFYNNQLKNSIIKFINILDF